MSNDTVGKCIWCEKNYCMYCSKHKEWQDYCSSACAKEAENDKLETEVAK